MKHMGFWGFGVLDDGRAILLFSWVFFASRWARTASFILSRTPTNTAEPLRVVWFPRAVDLRP